MYDESTALVERPARAVGACNRDLITAAFVASGWGRKTCAGGRSLQPAALEALNPHAEWSRKTCAGGRSLQRDRLPSSDGIDVSWSVERPARAVGACNSEKLFAA